MKNLKEFYRKVDDINLYSIKSPVFNYRKSEFIQMLKKHKHLFGRKALDVGCGGGVSSFALEELGLDVTGIDIQEEMIRKAKEAAHLLKSKVKFIVGDIETINLDEKFDSVFLLGNVIAHISITKFNNIISKIKELLTDNGVLVIHYFDTISEIWNRDFFIKSPQMVGKEVYFTYDSDGGYVNITLIEKQLRDDLYEAVRFKLYIWAPWILENFLKFQSFSLLGREYLPRNAYLDIYEKTDS